MLNPAKAIIPLYFLGTVHFINPITSIKEIKLNSFSFHAGTGDFLIAKVSPNTESPWYNDATNVISILALVVSGITAIYTLTSENSQEVRAKKEELREIITTLIDAQENYQDKIKFITDPQAQEAINVSLNTRQLLYLEAAEALIAKIPQHVSWIEYEHLANMYSYAGNNKLAEKHYKKALDVARQNIVINHHAGALRALGFFYYQLTTFRDFKKAQGYYKNAIDILANETDAYSKYLRGNTYEQWGLVEMANNSPEEGRKYLEEARQCYENLPLEFPLRYISLNTLDNKIANQLGYIAWNYFQKKTPQYIGKGREYYLKASELLEKKIDPHSKYTLGYLYETWGFHEIFNYFDESGNELLKQAHETYAKLPPDFPSLQIALARLATQESTAIYLRSQQTLDG